MSFILFCQIFRPRFDFEALESEKYGPYCYTKEINAIFVLELRKDTIVKERI